ncbi:RNA polymerase I-specific transcription-initiation factor domain containing protein [Rhypophila decipiens]
MAESETNAPRSHRNGAQRREKKQEVRIAESETNAPRSHRNGAQRRKKKQETSVLTAAGATDATVAEGVGVGPLGSSGCFTSSWATSSATSSAAFSEAGTGSEAFSSSVDSVAVPETASPAAQLSETESNYTAGDAAVTTAPLKAPTIRCAPKTSSVHTYLQKYRGVEKDGVHFQQVTDFLQWCPRTRESVTTPVWSKSPKGGPESRRERQRETRRQRQQLQHDYPQASLAVESTPNILVEDIEDFCPRDDTSTTCLMATGEISDLTKPGNNVGHPVLAIAAGRLGNNLRLVSLSKRKWAWTEEDAGAVLNTPRFILDEQLPGKMKMEAITCLKFALDVKPRFPIRWLVVQQAACTTVYELELQPSVDGRRTSPPTLFLTSLATIQSQQTGGAHQCDFLFRSRSGAAAQLVIIDKSGTWSLWDLTVPGGGERWARRLRPVVRMHGIIPLGAIPRGLAPPAKRQKIECTHKMLILSAARQSELRNGWESANETIADKDTPAGTPFLLVSNGASLYRQDLKPHTPAAEIPSFLQPGRKILDIAKSTFDPSAAFILTDGDLLWVSAKEDEMGGVSLHLRMSWPLLLKKWSPFCKALRLEVSPAPDVNGSKACYIYVRSSRHSRMLVFRVLHSDSDGAQYRPQRTSLQYPVNFIGMAMLPVRRTNQEAGESLIAGNLAKARAQCFQILVLSRDLEVSSALCVLSDNPDLKLGIPPPTMFREITLRSHRAGPVSKFKRRMDLEGKVLDPEDEELGPVPRTQLNIPLTLTKGGQWHDHEMEDDDGTEDTSMENDKIKARLKRASCYLPRRAKKETGSLVKAMAAQLKDDDIHKAATGPQFKNKRVYSQAPSQPLRTYQSSFREYPKPKTYFAIPHKRRDPRDYRIRKKDNPELYKIAKLSAVKYLRKYYGQPFKRPLSSKAIRDMSKSIARKRGMSHKVIRHKLNMKHGKYTVLFGPTEWVEGDWGWIVDFDSRNERLTEAFARAEKRDIKIKKKKRFVRKVWKALRAQKKKEAKKRKTDGGGGGGAMLASSTQPDAYSRFKNRMFMSSQAAPPSSLSRGPPPLYSSQAEWGRSVLAANSQVASGKFGDKNRKKKGGAKPIPRAFQ